MNENQLRELLLQADAPHATRAPAKVVAGVVRLWQRRQQARQIRGTTLALLLALVGTTLLWQRREAPVRVVSDYQPAPSVPHPGEAESPDWRAQLAALEREVAARSSVADQAMSLKRASVRLASLKASSTTTVPTARQRAVDSAERAAATLVANADRLLTIYELRESAIRDYRETIRLFPRTSWAAVARQRLHELNILDGRSQRTPAIFRGETS